MVFGERPEARLVDIRFAEPIESEVVKRRSDASAPALRPHIQGVQDTVAHGDHSDGLFVLECNVRLRVGVGECRDPVRANRIRGELMLWWEDVLEARNRGSTRDLKTQLGVFPRRAHDPHVRRSYCGRKSGTSSRLAAVRTEA